MARWLAGWMDFWIVRLLIRTHSLAFMVLGPIIDRSIVLLSRYQPALYVHQISNPANFTSPLALIAPNCLFVLLAGNAALIGPMKWRSMPLVACDSSQDLFWAWMEGLVKG